MSVQARHQSLPFGWGWASSNPPHIHGNFGATETSRTWQAARNPCQWFHTCFTSQKSSCQAQSCHPAFHSSLESPSSWLSQPLRAGYKHQCGILGEKWRKQPGMQDKQHTLPVWVMEEMPSPSSAEEWPLPTQQGFPSPSSAANFNS